MASTPFRSTVPYRLLRLHCFEDGQQVKNRSVYLALGINAQGHKELLGLWLSGHESSRFWLGVLAELKNRGLEDILIACVDGLKGLPDAIRSTYPQTQVQLCIVDIVRHSLKFVLRKDYKQSRPLPT